MTKTKHPSMRLSQLKKNRVGMIVINPSKNLIFLIVNAAPRAIDFCLMMYCFVLWASAWSLMLFVWDDTNEVWFPAWNSTQYLQQASVLKSVPKFWMIIGSLWPQEVRIIPLNTCAETNMRKVFLDVKMTGRKWYIRMYVLNLNLQVYAITLS